MILRPYQQEAEQAIVDALNNGNKAPLVCLPTGSGKTLNICTRLKAMAEKFPDERFVCTVHTQELLEQLHSTYVKIGGKKGSIYSASLGIKKIDQVTFGQIQSIYKRATDFGRIKAIIIDECDRSPVEGEGQYRTFIKECRIINPEMRIIGYTATPYRPKTGMVFGKGQPFESMVYDAEIRRLIDDGYLSKLVSKDRARPDLSSVGIRNGDYANNQLEAVMSDDATVERACEEIIKYGSDRRAWLIFCSGVKHAQLVANALMAKGIESPVIDGKLAGSIREQLITRYRNKDLKCLININVLSVGFDAPHVDMIVLLRPTLSPGLFYQQCGRGLRICDGKSNCLILDMAGNIAKHGPIDTLNSRITSKKKSDEPGEAPTKTCEQCSEIVFAGLRICPACGTEFPPPKIVKHSTESSDDSALAEIKELRVTNCTYHVQAGKEGKPDTILVMYRIGLTSIVREWLSVSPNSNAWAHSRFLKWLIATPPKEIGQQLLTVSGGTVIAETPDGPLEIATAQAMVPFLYRLASPTTIKVRPNPDNPKYTDVMARDFTKIE